ncbi:hypothetical protein [Aquidulcibacter sp.]|uniref:hypothetical protein n=1 Tax=Aquidulcibacter sp. TaxID=2052990 RepID=UPI0025BFCD29|nr:hypothetical protein [Aquidulcibacter sp.]MCA3693790.1 hypothetical protein [Aquidulcibacter sp.]
MSTLLPGRPSTRSRLFSGLAIVAGTSLLNLVSLNLGPFGSIWPASLIWAACGWANQGPNALISVLLFLLGLWLDLLTGGPLGAWAVVALLAHGLTILTARLSVAMASTPLGSAAITGFFFLLAAFILSISSGKGFNVLAILVPIISAVITYPWLAPWFDLSEDEA